MNWKPLIFFALGFALSALAGLISSESPWNTPLLITASILMLVGMFFELKPTTKNPGYRLYQQSKYLSVKDFCKEILHVRRGDTTVVIQIETDGKLFVYENNTKSNSVTTDGKTDNQLTTNNGILTVKRYKEGYKVCWTEGMWALF